jgi:hypothetical protein
VIPEGVGWGGEEKSQQGGGTTNNLSTILPDPSLTIEEPPNIWLKVCQVVVKGLGFEGKVRVTWPHEHRTQTFLRLEPATATHQSLETRRTSHVTT